MKNDLLTGSFQFLPTHIYDWFQVSDEMGLFVVYIAKSNDKKMLKTMREALA
jgi:hypothetical protein